MFNNNKSEQIQFFIIKFDFWKQNNQYLKNKICKKNYYQYFILKIIRLNRRNNLYKFFYNNKIIRKKINFIANII